MPESHEPLPIAGYKAQSQANIDAVNAMKHHEELLLRNLDLLGKEDSVDKRWLAIGRTSLEQAFMAINRSIFKPGRVVLPNEAATERNPNT